MPWRDPSPLYPEVDTERGAGSISPPARVPLGVDTPATAPRAPEVAVAPSSTCSRPLCNEPVFSRLTGRCEAHGEEDLDRLREYLDDLGRGTFES